MKCNKDVRKLSYARGIKNIRNIEIFSLDEYV
jgi:hypothetical protein